MAPALLEGVRQDARVPAKAVRCWSRTQIEVGPRSRGFEPTPGDAPAAIAEAIGSAYRLAAGGG